MFTEWCGLITATATFLFAFLWHCQSSFLLVFGVPVDVVRVSPVLDEREPKRALFVPFKRRDYVGAASIQKL